MSWTNEKKMYDAIVKEIEPAARLVTKDSWIWPTLWWVATILTFGLFALGMSKKVFLEEYATTLFPIQGYSSKWRTLSMPLLVHECRHTTHCVWLGYLVPILGWIPGYHGRHLRAWCGAPFYTVIYVLALLPSVFALGRWLIELDADRTSWRWQLRNGYRPWQVRQRAKAFGEKVCSGRYFWSWLKVFGGVALFRWTAERVIKDESR